MTVPRTVTVLLLGAGLVVVAGLGAFAVARRPAAAPPGPPELSAATVTRETLVDITTASGTLAYGPEQAAESRLAGTVTALAPVGATVGRGEPLFRIDDQPVVLFFGDLPAYRELTAGRPAGTTSPTPDASGAAAPADDAEPATVGADVQQFEENLQALGYTGFTVDDRYTGQTAVAVRRWQKSLGLAQTGRVELGRVFYAPGPVRIAAHKLNPGAVATGPVLTFTGATRLVTVPLPRHDQALAKPQTKVTVALPDGAEVPGVVRSVRTPAGDPAGPGREPTVEVVVALSGKAKLADLDDGPVEVRFVAREVKDVLVVPVGALLALAEGGYGLEVVQDGTARVVAVTTGLFANGKVEVSGPDVRDGMTVRMAR